MDGEHEIYVEAPAPAVTSDDACRTDGQATSSQGSNECHC